MPRYLKTLSDILWVSDGKLSQVGVNDIRQYTLAGIKPFLPQQSPQRRED